MFAIEKMLFTREKLVLLACSLLYHFRAKAPELSNHLLCQELSFKSWGSDTGNVNLHVIEFLYGSTSSLRFLHNLLPIFTLNSFVA